MLGYLLLYFSSCVNPIIYVIMNKQYRQAYAGVISCSRISNLLTSHGSSAPGHQNNIHQQGKEQLLEINSAQTIRHELKTIPKRCYSKNTLSANSKSLLPFYHVLSTFIIHWRRLTLWCIAQIFIIKNWTKTILRFFFILMASNNQVKL